MKFWTLWLIVAGGIFVSGVSVADTSLNVSGTLVASTCTVNFPPKVTIGTFSGKDFPSIGSTSSFKAISINLMDCYSKLSTVSVTFSGVSDADNPVLLAVTDPGTGGEIATGVGIELMDNSGRTIPFNNVKPLSFTLDEGMTTLSFLLRYKSTKYPVTSGEAPAILNFDLAYQ
ncbi:fimbrial protein [Enterobacter roggenkampii]|uniref:fimbrial protein n=1 Tax=Enterobacter roggenkampii TaxID=1812935 RepID=UPI001237C35B|nr:fimbrial protein [Enterobacter roggenkampii]